jgi:hypothetical protein
MRDNTTIARRYFAKEQFSFTQISLSIMCLVIVLSGCSTKINVKGNFPKPVVHQMPLAIGVHFPVAFSEYRYIEQSETRSDRDIGIGQAQVQLFSTILPAMFKSVVPVAKPEKGQVTDAVDLILSFSVDDFQYSVPKETRVEMYEVWIKYNLQLFDPQGQLIADWLLTAYGKTPVEMLKTEGDALNAAMVVALRDAGAGFSLNFTKVPEIKQWLQQRSNSNI